MTAAGFGDVLAAGDRDEGALRQVRHGLAVLAGALEVAGVDRRRGELAGLRGVRSAPGPPHAAGLDPVGVGGCVAHGLEGVAPVAEVLRPVGDEFQLAGLDLGAVLLALEVAQAGHQLVGCAVEALGLGVEHVDEAPEQALAFVGELRAVRSDALGEDAEGLAHRVDGIVGIPDVPGVELVALGRRAVERCVLAGCCCCGMFVGFDPFDDGHDDLPILSCTVRSVCPEVMVLWDTRAQRSHRGRNEWPGAVREWCGRRERSD